MTSTLKAVRLAFFAPSGLEPHFTVIGGCATNYTIRATIVPASKYYGYAPLGARLHSYVIIL